VILALFDSVVVSGVVVVVVVVSRVDTVVFSVLAAVALGKVDVEDVIVLLVVAAELLVVLVVFDADVESVTISRKLE
jgi:hypothetical protein